MASPTATTLSPAQPAPTGHPTGLFVLFTTEMWERFAYYGMRAILKLYMAKALLFDEKFSSEIYGSYTGLVYLTPLLGGYIADRYWGNRRSILFGGLVMALGQFTLFGSASTLGNPGASHLLFYIGLALMILGNGFFKPNISSMVGTLYPPADSRIDAAYTIFYMGINLGAFFSPFVCGFLGDTGYPGDFRYGFLAAGIGMVIGAITFEWLKNKHVVRPDGSPLGARPERKVASADAAPAAKMETNKMLMLGGLFVAVFAAWYFLVGVDLIGALIFTAMIVVPLIVISDPSLTAREKEKIYVVLILSFFVIFFWGAFEQAGNSLTSFADRKTDRMIGTYLVPASFFQSINALAVIVFATPFALLWSVLAKRGLEPSSPLKMAYGLALLAIGYLVIALGVKDASATSKVSMYWLVGLYVIHTFGELCLSPIGLALVNKLSPARFASLMMAVWFLSTAAGNKFSGTLGALYPEQMVPVSKVEQLDQQVTAHLLAHPDQKPKPKTRTSVHLFLDSIFGTSGSQTVDKPKDFTLFPEKFDKAKNDNELAGVKVISADNVRLEEIADKTLREKLTEEVYQSLVPNPKKFIGITISTFYDFFMVFVVLCGAAAFVLLLIYRILVRMMDGNDPTPPVQLVEHQ